MKGRFSYFPICFLPCVTHHSFCALRFTGNVANLLFHTKKQFMPVQLESNIVGDNIEIIGVVKDWINLCNFQ